MLCAALAGCGEQATLPAQAPSVSGGAVAPAAPSPNEATRRAASAQLVMQAQTVTSPAWREENRSLLERANQQAGLAPTSAQLEAQLDEYRNEKLLQILASMEAVGGPEAVAYCLALGENEAAPAVLRKAALAVLVRHVDRSDPVARARSAAIWDRLTATSGAVKGSAGSLSTGSATISGGAVANAQQVVAGMQAGFRRCYIQGLHEDVNMSGSVRVTAKIDATGAVASAQESHTGLSPTVVSCVVARVTAAVFAPPEGGGATIVIPVTFASM